ncbi:hypothetical protein PsalMR5_04324 (plasmid) [Piscirickettsia salmonis]|nr:hypothetical protein PsalBI1_04189 [Piscirickettsia salmonis]QGP66399.1 hypothetical protein PsalMR5_04324 [Piscirickettsia salmonis]
MVECADSRHATLCDADSRGFIVVAFCSAILHHWMCKIPTEVATLTHEGVNEYIANPFYFARGDWKKIVEQREAFQMKITYTEQGRTITTAQIEK